MFTHVDESEACRLEDLPANRFKLVLEHEPSSLSVLWTISVTPTNLPQVSTAKNFHPIQFRALGAITEHRMERCSTSYGFPYIGYPIARLLNSTTSERPNNVSVPPFAGDEPLPK